MNQRIVVVLVALVLNQALATCPVKFPSGKSYNLNFGNIKGVEGTSFEYYYNFCDTVPTNIYQGVTCPNAGNAYQIQLSTNPVTCTLIGNMGTATLAELPNGGGLQINMTNEVCCKCVNNAVTRTVAMNVLCGQTPSINGFTVTEPPNPKCQYISTITHPNACPNAATGGVTIGTTGNAATITGVTSATSTTGDNGGHHKGGLSGGSIFLIAFFVSAVVYLVAGFIVNWKVRGATPGVDAVPNIELWRQVPGLVVDGIVFTKNKVMGLFGRGYNQL
jgi:hypothetical protein